MSTKKQIGRIPVSKGEYVAGQTYNRLNQVTMYGSTYQSRVDGNTSAPAIMDSNGNVQHANTDQWLVIADGREAYNAGEKLSCFSLQENDEFLEVKKDEDGKILESITSDGSKNINLPVNYNNAAKVLSEDSDEWIELKKDIKGHILEGISSDGKKYINLPLENPTTEEIKDRISHLSLEDSEEFLALEKDKDGRILSSVNADGSHYIYNVKSETIPEGFSNLEDEEDRIEITKDKDGRLISYTKANGDKVFLCNVESKNINKLEESKNVFSDSIYANDSDIQVDEPSIATVYLNAVKFPSSKTDNVKGTMVFHSSNGYYFRRNVLINLQGSTSMGMPKKNIAIDIVDDNYENSLKIKFGSWVPQDSFHLKAYYFDLTKGVAPTAYQLYEQIAESNGFENDKPYKMYRKTIQEGGASIDDLEDSFSYEPLCHPMGFPCMLYWNGEFYGLMSWQLKKHRDNYAMNKKNAKHIHLDGVITKDTLFGGNVNWSSFEIRNPKSLVCADGTDYDGDNPNELIDDTMEKYDSSNKNHVNTLAVKNAIIKFSKYMGEIDTVIASSPNDTDTIKKEIEKRFDVTRLIDYLLFIWAVSDTDSTAKNWQWLSYDAVMLTVEPYDLDSCWGIGAALTGHFLSDEGKKYIFGAQDNPLSYIYKYYQTELKARWKSLRDQSIIDSTNIYKLYLSWYNRVGYDNIKAELDRWKETPCYREVGMSSAWELTGKSYITYNGLSTDWSNSRSYNAGDKCRYNNRLYESLSSANVSHVPTDSTYWKDLTFVSGKTYNEGDACYWGYTTFYECKCKSQTDEQPFKLYKEYPQELSNGFDSLIRLYRYAKNTIAYLDTQLDYK